MKFQIPLTWELSPGVSVDLVVSGGFEASKGNRTRGHPDTWAEPWIELDVMGMKVENGHGCPLPPLVVSALCAQDSFLRAVEAKIEEVKSHGG
jgi:hypothetical protein